MSHNSSSGFSGRASGCCFRATAELKLYQTFIFSIPIFFTFILLFLFYFFYLRRRRADWASLRMRTTPNNGGDQIFRSEMGLKKEVREMLPILVFKESFSVRDTRCSVCLTDYQVEDKLQQIPACGHTFHMYCIDLWLASHTTCPLCRLSLLPPSKSSEPPDIQAGGNCRSNTHNGNASSDPGSLQSGQDPQTSQQNVESDNRTETTLKIITRAEGSNSCFDGDTELQNIRIEN